MTTRVEHPHVTSRDGVCGGRPVIAGSRFTVRSVVGYVLNQGWTPEELVRDFPHLTLAKIYDALSYYYDYKDEIDKDMEENSEETAKDSRPA